MDKSIGLRPHSSLRSACPNRSLRSLGALPGASGPRPAREKTGPGTPQPGRGPCGKCSLARIRLRNPRDEAAGRSPPVECTYSAHPSRRVCGRRPPRRQSLQRWAGSTGGTRPPKPVEESLRRNSAGNSAGNSQRSEAVSPQAVTRPFVTAQLSLWCRSSAVVVPLKCRFRVTETALPRRTTGMRQLYCHSTTALSTDYCRGSDTVVPLCCPLDTRKPPGDVLQGAVCGA